MRQLAKFNSEDYNFYEFKFKESIDFLNFGKLNSNDRWGPKELGITKYMTSDEMDNIKEAINNNPTIIKDFVIITNNNELKQTDGYVCLDEYLPSTHKFYNIRMPSEYFIKRSTTEEEYKAYAETIIPENIYNFHKIDKDISYTSIRVGSITEANTIINEGINQGWVLISHEITASGDLKNFIQMKRKNNGSI